MDGGGAQYNPRTVEEVFRDFKGRRAGMIKALTIDVEDFYQQCDPDKENLCLYGYPSEQWEVNLPAEEVPPELPEPALGINFARDGMQEKDWLALVAVHSDAWLLAVAFYFGARFGFDRSDRKRLFTMINDFPTVYEVVTGAAMKQVKMEKSSVSNHSSTKSKPNPKACCQMCGFEGHITPQCPWIYTPCTIPGCRGLRKLYTCEENGKKFLKCHLNCVGFQWLEDAI